MKPPRERVLEELKRVADEWRRGFYTSDRSFTLDELLDAAVELLEEQPHLPLDAASHTS